MRPSAFVVVCATFFLLPQTTTVLGLPSWKDSWVIDFECTPAERAILHSAWTTLQDLLTHRSLLPGLDPTSDTPLTPHKLFHDSGWQPGDRVTDFDGHTAKKTVEGAGTTTTGKALALKYFGSKSQPAVTCLNGLASPMPSFETQRLKFFCSMDGFWHYVRRMAPRWDTPSQVAIVRALLAERETMQEESTRVVEGVTHTGYATEELRTNPVDKLRPAHADVWWSPATLEPARVNAQLEAQTPFFGKAVVKEAKQSWRKVQQQIQGSIVVDMKVLCPGVLNLVRTPALRGAALVAGLLHELSHLLCVTADHSVMPSTVRENNKAAATAELAVNARTMQLLRDRDQDKAAKNAASLTQWFMEAVLCSKTGAPPPSQLPQSADLVAQYVATRLQQQQTAGPTRPPSINRVHCRSGELDESVPATKPPVPPKPDKAKVVALWNMGFGWDFAEWALQETGGDLARAKQFLKDTLA